MSLFHPVDVIRIYELAKLQKMEDKLQAQGLPVPPWLSDKITDLHRKLSQ